MKCLAIDVTYFRVSKAYDILNLLTHSKCYQSSEFILFNYYVALAINCIINRDKNIVCWMSCPQRYLCVKCSNFIPPLRIYFEKFATISQIFKNYFLARQHECDLNRFFFLKNIQCTDTAENVWKRIIHCDM